MGQVAFKRGQYQITELLFCGYEFGALQILHTSQYDLDSWLKRELSLCAHF